MYFIGDLFSTFGPKGLWQVTFVRPKMYKEEKATPSCQSNDFRDGCLSSAATLLDIAGHADSEEEISPGAIEKLKKITELIGGIGRELFETGTEVPPPGSSQLPPEGDRQTSHPGDSQREKNPAKGPN